MTEFYKKVKNREKTIGTHINICDPCISKIVATKDFDFCWIDTEHSYMSYEMTLTHINILQGYGMAAVVRVPQHDLTSTKKILEMGPDGIIFPMVRSAEEANELISYTLYPPYGKRGFGPMNAVDYGGKDVDEYVGEGHKKMLRFIQIEHIDAVKCLDELMQNEYIDGFIIGANDLSGSINELGKCFDHNTQTLIKETIEKLHANGKYVGLSTGATDSETIKRWHDIGIDMLSAGADFGYIEEMCRYMSERLRRNHSGVK